MRLIYCLQIFFFLFQFTQLSAQFSIKSKRYNNWYFGNKAGISFSGDTVQALTDGQMAVGSVGEGCASISDKYGRLLFYTDGHTIWNACGDTMLNGDSLLSNPSSTQAALITPVIGDSNRYYIFTVGDMDFGAPTNSYPHIGYSVVDMCLDNGRGGIVDSLKNIVLSDTLDPWGNSEKLTAMKHANGIDYWVITRSQKGQTYTAFLVTAAGVDTIPVVSANDTAGGGFGGYLKASHNGDFLVACFIWGIPPLGGYAELCRFDNATGIVDTAIQLSQAKYVLIVEPGTAFYGAEFSPDDSFIYVSAAGGIAPAGSASVLYRYQTYAPDPRATEDTLGDLFGLSALALGPDGNIYTPAAAGTNNVVVILNPNSKSPPQIYGDTIPLLTGLTRVGLPNIFYYYTDEDTSLIPPIEDLPYAGLLDSVFIDTCSGQTLQLGIPNNSCRAYAWTFAAGLNDTTLAQPTANVEGQYIVTVDYKCDTYIDTVVLWTSDSIITTIGSDQNICSGNITVLSVTGGLGYIWSPGNTLDDSTKQNPIAFPNDTTNYQVIINGGSCGNDTQNVTLNVIPTPIIDLGTDTFVCEKSSIQLNGTALGKYQWTPSTGLSNDTIPNPVAQPTTSTTYILRVNNYNCMDEDTIIITVEPLPLASTNADTVICKGSSVQFIATGGDTYLWLPGKSLNDSTISNPIAIPLLSTDYLLLTTNQCGTDTTTTTITVQGCEIYVPNAFTPNGDGKNDIFQIQGSGITQINMKIYDRWGKRVFESFSMNTSWKGIGKNGEIANAGVYVYVIRGLFNDGSDIDLKGNVSLLR